MCFIANFKVKKKEKKRIKIKKGQNSTRNGSNESKKCYYNTDQCSKV